MYRTHNCGTLTKVDENKTVTLSGWVVNPKNHGGLIFSYLRDRYGVTQLVFDSKDKELFKIASELKREDVIKVEGNVVKRPKEMLKEDIATGEIEVHIKTIEILNKCGALPIEINDKVNTSDEMRLKYRYLDLRREEMQNKLLIRHKVAQAIREYLSSKLFLEIETPMLVRSTPEGARDYIVPSRVHHGNAYSLPQSPQLYKQILMVSGCDRYFQLAKCMRDEDLRADRQPEFTQVDLEMSFVEQDDVLEIIDGLIKHTFEKGIGKKINVPIQRLSYEEAMLKFGTDKPDLRFGLELKDITEEVKNSEFSVFSETVKNGGIIKVINPENELSRKEIDELTEIAKRCGAKGLAWTKINNGLLDSGISKFLKESEQKEILKKSGAKNGTLLFVADNFNVTNFTLATIRNELGRKLNLIDESEFRFCWIVDYPLFEWDDEENRWSPAHHMFTMPKAEHIEHLDKDPAKVKATLYDLVLNGVELGSGSIRIHREDIQEKVMKVIGLDKKEAHNKFGFLLESFRYGAPPHGGIALGFDRLVALMCGTNDIREVIAFPKNKSGQNPMDNCPSPIEDNAAKEVHIKVVKDSKNS